MGAMEGFYYFSILLLQEADSWRWGSVALLLVAGGGWLALRRVPGWTRIVTRMTGEILLVAGLALAASTVYQVWITHRPLPAEIQETLFEGVTYTRNVRREPRPLVIHVVSIEPRYLETTGLISALISLRFCPYRACEHGYTQRR